MELKSGISLNLAASGIVMYNHNRTHSHSKGNLHCSHSANYPIDLL